MRVAAFPSPDLGRYVGMKPYPSSRGQLRGIAMYRRDGVGGRWGRTCIIN